MRVKVGDPIRGNHAWIRSEIGCELSIIRYAFKQQIQKNFYRPILVVPSTRLLLNRFLSISNGSPKSI